MACPNSRNGPKYGLRPLGVKQSSRVLNACKIDHGVVHKSLEQPKKKGSNKLNPNKNLDD
jgi:hypothetical protein